MAMKMTLVIASALTLSEKKSLFIAGGDREE